MNLKLTGLLMMVAIGLVPLAGAQDAAQPTVDLQSPKPPAATPQPTPILPADVPELSKLDEAFKQSSLGKAADEFRTRVELRRLQNEIVHDPAVTTAKAEAEKARTDWDKRERLREYYRLYYGRMRARASSEASRKAIDQDRDAHLGLLSQPRVRPATDSGLPTPPPERKKGKKK